MNRPPAGKRLFDLELLIVAISLAYSLAFLTDVWDLRFEAAILPQVVCGVIVFFSLYILAGKINKYRRGVAAGPVAVDDEEGLAKKGRGRQQKLLPWWATYASMLAYLLLIYLIGIFWGTILFTLGLPLLMRYQRWRMAMVVGVLVSLAMFYSFSEFLHIVMPAGLFFE